MRVPKRILNKTAQEHITVTIKKATELFVVGGVAYEPSTEKHVFWYAVRKYPVMSRRFQRETGTKSKTEYVQKHRSEWAEGEEPPEGYTEFYKELPRAFEEGAPEQIQKAHPAQLRPSVTIIEPTKIEYDIEATGDSNVDVPVVEEIIKKIRQLIWDFPVEGRFTSITGLQGDRLRQFINSNLKKAFRDMRLRKFAQNLRIIPEATRFIDVATGTIFTSEDAVKQAIEEYHAEPQLAAAASKGGIFMNSIGELLKVADMLDERGDFESADEIVAIIKDMADESEKEGQKAPQTQAPTEEKKAWARHAVATLVKVADSLDSKGAVKEAQMADQLLLDLKEALPQAFNLPWAPSEMAPSEMAPTTTGPSSIEVEPQETDQDQGLLPTETETNSDATTVENTPFNDLLDTQEEKSELREVEIEEPSEPEPSYDEMTIPEFKEMIEGLRWRHSQGPKRQRYEEVLKNLERADEYLRAHKEWSEYAHKMFESEPIRIKFE